MCGKQQEETSRKKSDEMRVIGDGMCIVLLKRCCTMETETFMRGKHEIE